MGKKNRPREHKRPALAPASSRSNPHLRPASNSRLFVVVLHHDNFPHARVSPHSSATARATTVNCRSVSLLFLPAAFHCFHNLHAISIIRLFLPDTLLQAEKRALAMSNDGSGDHVKAALDIYDKDALMLVRPSHLTPLPFLSFSLFSSPSRALFSYVAVAQVHLAACSGVFHSIYFYTVSPVFLLRPLKCVSRYLLC